MIQRTPITDRDQVLDIIDHINQDHLEELRLLTQSFTDYPDAEHVVIRDIYQEGVLVSLHCRGQTTEQEAFVPFQLDGTLEEQILYLAYLAMAKQGNTLSTNRKQFFTVTGSERITPNILRIFIRSAAPLPDNRPGYAYWLALKSLQQPPKAAVEGSGTSRMTQWFNCVLLWLMKRVSSKRREKILHSMSKGARYYTLRQTWRSEDDKDDCGCIDVFLHGNTAGSNWAKGLKAGDVIYSQAEKADKQDHLKQGKALLIADETAYPALAAILEAWQNPEPPQVIILSAADSEQAYFTAQSFPDNSNVIRITCPPKTQGERCLAVINTLPQIDTAWGALEDNAAKTIRHYLRNQRGLNGKVNRITAYWRLGSDG